MKKRKLTSAERTEYKARRRARALTVGTEWIYFNRRTPATATTPRAIGAFHPWNGCTIKIVKARKTSTGRLILRARLHLSDAEAMLRNAHRGRRKPITTELPVTYSELW